MRFAQGDFVVEPFNEASHLIWEQREHVVLGVSPGNSYFRVSRLTELLGWLRAEFARVDVIIPDSALEYTYLALGYEPQRAAQKTRGEINVLRNRIVRAWDSHGGPRETDGLHRMSDLTENPMYQEKLAEVERALERDRSLWETCASMSRDVLAARGYVGPLDTERVERAVRYLKAELPFFLASADIFGAPTSMNFYHHRLPLAELIFSGKSLLQASPRQAYATIHPADEGEAHVSDQYDRIVKIFNEVENAIRFVRENLEFPSFRRTLGSLDGQQVLDGGCGEGTFTRMIKLQGARRAVGVDQSEGMIKLAQEIENRDPLGIEYHVHDLATMPVLGAFDVVTAVHVLHYADSRETMTKLAERMFANLAPGGRLVTLVANAESSARSEEASGFRTYRPDNPQDAARFRVSVLTDPPTDIYVHHWPSESIANVLESVGFTKLTWTNVEVSEETAPEDLERARRAAEHPTSRLLTAIKPA